MLEKSTYLLNVLQQLANFIEVSSELEDRITQETKVVKQPKMTILEQEDDSDTGNLWYLVRGVACSTQYDHVLEEERPVLLWKKGDILFQPESFFENKTLQESIQLWDESILIGISYFRLQQLLQHYPQLTPILARTYGIRARRLSHHNSTLAYPAIQRVSELLATYPGIQTKVKQELLAKYLHIDRRTFNVCLKQLQQHKQFTPKTE